MMRFGLLGQISMDSTGVSKIHKIFCLAILVKEKIFRIGVILDPVLLAVLDSGFTKFLLLQKIITAELCAISRNFGFNNNNNNKLIYSLFFW